MKEAWVVPLLLALLFNRGPAWERTYGGSADDRGYSVQQTTDGGYIVAGLTRSYGAGNIGAYLIKTDSLGIILWTKIYGAGTNSWATSVQQTADGGYIITGTTSAQDGGHLCVYLVKTDARGDSLWARVFGDTTWNSGHSVRQTGDGGYIIAGETVPDGRDDADVYLVKTNAEGEILWTKTYGDSLEDIGYSVRPTVDGGYIIAGSADAFSDSLDNLFGDACLIKTDAGGNPEWRKTYGGADADWALSVQQTADGGFIFTGITFSFGAGLGDAYLVKTDDAGDTLWTKSLGMSGGECGYSVQQTSDGGYIVAGGSDSRGVDHVYLIKTDARGDTLWTRPECGKKEGFARSIEQTADGGYIITGVADPTRPGGPDVYLIKTDSAGVSGVEETGNPTARPEYPLKVQSPFHGVLNLSFFLPAFGRAAIELFDCAGKKVGTLTDGDFSAGWHGLQSKPSVPVGVYFVKLTVSAHTVSVTRKIILLK